MSMGMKPKIRGLKPNGISDFGIIDVGSWGFWAENSITLIEKDVKVFFSATYAINQSFP